jgi:hypothetical protein
LSLPFGALVVLAAAFVSAQEVAFIDLTGVTQRTEIRYPPAPPPKEGHGVGGGFGGAGIACGASDPKDKRALRTTLLWLDRETIRNGDLVTSELRVENAGSVPLDIPVHPHLSDLQPEDESQKFDYNEFSLVLEAGSHGEVPLGSISLYGSLEKPETMVTLQPGEWVRVRGEIQIGLTSTPNGNEVNVGFWWHQSTVKPGVGGYSVGSTTISIPQRKGEAKAVSFAGNEPI